MNGKQKYIPDQRLKLMDQVKAVLRYHHYAYRTEQAYCDWILKYVLFHNKKHQKSMGESEVRQFLTHLADQDHVAASPPDHNQSGRHPKPGNERFALSLPGCS